MTDAQQLFDYARRQFNEIADDVERHFEQVAGQLKQFVPNQLRTVPTPKRLPPPTTLELAQRWISRHKALTYALVAFVVTGSVGAIVFAKSREHKKKRRARRSASGARTDVVVVAGAVANPLTSALYLDLERRGFVVYVVANTSEDEHFIRAQSRVDLLPLHIDPVDPFHAQDQINRFTALLDREHQAFDRAEPHRLNFVGFIIAPDTQTTPARVDSISSEEWSNALNAKVLNTIATTQLFLPSIIEHKAKILLLTPAVTPALRLPRHAVESTVYGALKGFTSSLAAELQTEGITVSHFKLGHIDVPSITAKQRREGITTPRFKPTPLRQLHDSVFDAMVSKNPRATWHVGRGSLAYDIIGSWLPQTAIGWMMGAGRRPNIVEQVKEEDLQGSAGSLTWEKVESEA
ncbi:Hypothetical protein R9X50_00553100 [Acrodontium crateriforme]|uniref:DUF1776-domain-containing protein n=1 Tax=Acrodontium crateriforme TaxID=150365 RepID=A0AAQ3M7C4_9PEZI|nr:Hypothetical protein R9X50_00553100 [Acrodontium crateriforme]